MRFILYAKGSRGVAVLKSLLEKKFPPQLIVLEKEDNRFIEFLKTNRIEIIICNKPKNRDHIIQIKKSQSDLILAAGYSKILPEDLISIPKLGAINCHGGRLPFYRGASPIPWQIINGETKGGAYVLKMTPGIDDGPILAKKEYPIAHNETARHITERVNTIFSELVPKVIEKFANGIEIDPEIQDETKACVWTRRIPSDGLIKWDQMTAKEIINLIRALDDPYPGAFTFFGGKKVIIKESVIPEQKYCGVPGRYIGKRNGLLTILAKDQAVSIKLYSVENGTATDFSPSYGDTMGYTIQTK